MTDRDLTPEQAHDFALAMKWREDFAAAIRALKREFWSVYRPPLEAILRVLQRRE